jgi:hypothetical protein
MVRGIAALRPSCLMSVLPFALEFLWPLCDAGLFAFSASSSIAIPLVISAILLTSSRSRTCTNLRVGSVSPGRLTKGALRCSVGL